MRQRDPDIPRKILKLISEKPCGLTIQDVANELKINRTTARVYLTLFIGQGKILVRDLGKAKLHYPKTRRVESWLL
jgi:response regulator of citrate/malate metabolism